MHLEQLRPTVLRVTLHTYEWASLVAAARWALREGEEDLPPQAQDQLKQVLTRYDDECQRLDTVD